MSSVLPSSHSRVSKKPFKFIGNEKSCKMQLLTLPSRKQDIIQTCCVQRDDFKDDIPVFEKSNKTASSIITTKNNY